MKRIPQQMAKFGTVVALLTFAGVVAVNTAYGTVPTGSAVTTALNLATINDRVIVNTDTVQLHVHEPTDVAQTDTVAQAGWSSGWHSHAGPVLVSLKSGSLRITNGHCDPETVSAGQVFVERPGVHYEARNLGPTTAEWLTTQLIPHGAPTRNDQPAACGI